MTTVAQMIEWMKTLPQDAEVECGTARNGSHQPYMDMAPVDIKACNVFDFTSEGDREKYPIMAGKVLVRLQGSMQ